VEMSKWAAYSRRERSMNASVDTAASGGVCRAFVRSDYLMHLAHAAQIFLWKCEFIGACG
jgi:hypothetical protein